MAVEFAFGVVSLCANLPVQTINVGALVWLLLQMDRSDMSLERVLLPENLTAAFKSSARECLFLLMALQMLFQFLVGPIGFVTALIRAFVVTDALVVLFVSAQMIVPLECLATAWVFAMEWPVSSVHAFVFGESTWPVEGSIAA